MQIEIRNKKITPDMLQPATEGSGGIDLRYLEDNPIDMFPDKVVKIDTGIAIGLNNTNIGLVVPRSSVGSRGLMLVNTVGIIDSDYRGNIFIKMKNTTDYLLQIKPMERLAQLIVLNISPPHKFEIISKLDDTERGHGGFGSTGES